ncbi:putative Isoprenylcysteine carboxyl methyltransferase (ICMT) family [Hibiscus syriacus]|uniref:Isoprenylcysteine carboxyl methyltransferase (ICMT) family n=1 Tax=Hibiscus syriacus TaxID=106335 RepID=A0A6A2XU42_HIBSY|nr:putative Isoprenylcysteine carboxyl methyltransferase (ICMT) family [Hibiscus syriacus]
MAAENGTRKLILEICNANNLMPKDGQGTASSYAIVDFDGQRRRTKTKFRDLNPVWDEKLEFLVHDIESMASKMLEINLYNDKKTVKGEIGVKVYYVDEEAAPVSAETAMDEKEETVEEKPPKNEKPEEEKKVEEEKPKEEAPKEEEKPAETMANKEEPPVETDKDKAETRKITELIINDLEIRSLSGDHNRVGKTIFQEAWQSDSGGMILETRAKISLSTKLWYLILTVRSPEIYVKAQLGAQVFKTSRTQIGSAWNEDLILVAAESFEPFLLVGVEDASNGQVVGEVKIHVSSIDRRTDDKTEVKSRWFNLNGGENKPYAGRIHVRVCLEGGYHVLDEAAHVTSNVRATVKQLAKPPIGSLDVGIREANNLLPVKTRDVQAYGSPMLPRMHHVSRLGPVQQETLGHTVMRIVTTRLARSEAVFGKVVQFILDNDTHVWSMRRSKANWFRVVRCLARWIDEIRTWTRPTITILVHGLLIAMVICPHLMLPTVFFLDELDEEFDEFPTTRSPDSVRIRYDRLGAVAVRAQTLMGDVAVQGERLESLFSWRDPRASGIFVVFCLFASLFFYLVPFKLFVLGLGFYCIRHPRFRGDMPSLPINFVWRLPSLSNQIM